MGQCDDIEVDLTPGNFYIALAPPISFEVGLSSTNFEVATSSDSYAVEITQPVLAFNLTPPVNFQVELGPTPTDFQVNWTQSHFDVAIETDPAYQVSVVQPDIVLTATAVGSIPGPPGPPGIDGSDGSDGISSFTVTTLSPFTVPPVGGTASVIVADASWIVVGQLIYVDTAGGGAGLAGALQVTAKSSNTLTLLNPVPPPSTGSSTVPVEIWGETPSGIINGVNTNFTSASPFRPNQCAVFLNGIRQRRTADYTETGSNSFQFVNAPLAGDSLSIDYIPP